MEGSYLLFVGDQAVCICWKHSDERQTPTFKHTNDVIGSYVTAGAKMHLYTYLDILQEKTLNCDTHFVVYVQPRGEPGLVETGDCLGAMTS